jgi:hypothetical protein
MPRDSKNPTNEAQQRLSQASCHQEICAEPKHQHQNGVPMKNDNMKRQRKSERRLDQTSDSLCSPPMLFLRAGIRQTQALVQHVPTRLGQVDDGVV